MRLAELVLLGLMAFGQPGTLDESVDAMAKPDFNVGHVRQYFSHYPPRDIIKTILQRLESDPNFARGTKAANWAVRILASVRGEDTPLRIGDRPQVEALAEALSWSEISTQLEVLRSVRMIDPEMRPLMVAAVSRLIMADNPMLVGEAIKAGVDADLALPAAVRERIRALALALDPQDEVWTAANARDANFVAAPEFVGQLRTAAVWSYLIAGDAPATAWQQVVDARGASGASVLHGAAMACAQLAERGGISKAGNEKAVFDCLVTLCNDPAARRAVEKGEFLMLFANQVCAPGEDQAIMARGLARLVVECGAISKAQNDLLLRMLRHCGFGDLADQVEGQRGTE